MTDMNDSPVVHADAEKAVPTAKVRKPVAVRKTTSKSGATLSLPPVTNANGSPNLVLLTTMKTKFSTLGLVKSADLKDKDITPVLDNDKVLGHLVQFVAALVTSYTGGTGIASDGATLYVDKYADDVMAKVPQLKTYDLIFSTSQSGAVRNRIPVTALIKMVRERASWVDRNIKRYGLTKTAHTRKGEKESKVFLV